MRPHYCDHATHGLWTHGKDFWPKNYGVIVSWGTAGYILERKRLFNVNTTLNMTGREIGTSLISHATMG
jgi:hypothetical protein